MSQVFNFLAILELNGETYCPLFWLEPFWTDNIKNQIRKYRVFEFLQVGHMEVFLGRLELVNVAVILVEPGSNVVQSLMVSGESMVRGQLLL